MDLCIVGRGRLGRSLETLLARTGHPVATCGRELAVGEHAVLLLCVPDSAIAEVAASLPRGRTVLHCSGATPVDVLRPHRPAGSFHPLMTFPGPEVALPELAGVPVALAGDPDAVAIGRELAARLGLVPFEVPGNRRLYHAAAVMAGNFATVLLAEASRVLAAAGVPEERAPALLAPLALASLRNAASGPAAALTGPAARGDRQVLDAHRAALLEAGLDDIAELYDALTERAARLAGLDPSDA